MAAAPRPPGGRSGTGNPVCLNPKQHLLLKLRHFQILPCSEKEVWGLWLLSDLHITE